MLGLAGLYGAGKFVGLEPGTAVEFYNPSLDHYLVTTLATEIADLDAGRHEGWGGTGQSFPVIPSVSPGSSGEPVCRYYGEPAAGTDSHFYSASKDECADVAVRFRNAGFKESDSVFFAALPACDTGSCPVEMSSVYRLWNARADSNYRYTGSLFTRQQMLSRGCVSEGYGPTGVAFCIPSTF